MLGCYLDIDNLSVEFALNGKSLGVAFSKDGENNAECSSKVVLADVDIEAKDIDFSPAASIDEHQRCLFNFGEKPFK